MTDPEKMWGGKRQGAGRPVGTKGSYKDDTVKKNGRIVVACTEDEMTQIKDLAKASGKSVSRFIVDKILDL